MKHGRGGGAGVSPENAVLIGSLLRERRRERGLTTEEVGESIRFGARQIVAVEEGRFADLPPQPYAQGLIRAYAAHVGLAPEELRRVCGPAFARETDGDRPSLFRVPARERFNWREWTVPGILAAAVATLVIARGVLEPARVEREAPSAVPAWRLRPVAEVGGPADVISASGEPAAAPAPEPGVRVIVRSEGTTWVDAVHDDGELRRYDLRPGQSLEITARERLALALGDAGALRLTVNGRELGYVGFKGQSKSGLVFTASRSGAAAAPGGADGD